MGYDILLFYLLDGITWFYYFGFDFEFWLLMVVDCLLVRRGVCICDCYMIVALVLLVGFGRWLTSFDFGFGVLISLFVSCLIVFALIACFWGTFWITVFVVFDRFFWLEVAWMISLIAYLLDVFDFSVWSLYVCLICLLLLAWDSLFTIYRYLVVAYAYLFAIIFMVHAPPVRLCSVCSYLRGFVVGIV